MRIHPSKDKLNEALWFLHIKIHHFPVGDLSSIIPTRSQSTVMPLFGAGSTRPDAVALPCNRMSHAQILERGYKSAAQSEMKLTRETLLAHTSHSRPPVLHFAFGDESILLDERFFKAKPL